MNEKLEKQKLEERIQSMQSQLLIGGHKIEDTPAFRSLLQQEHKRIRTEYEQRLAELEKERHTVEEDKAQVSRHLPSRFLLDLLANAARICSPILKRRGRGEEANGSGAPTGTVF
jgi:hypothetical protein